MLSRDQATEQEQERAWINIDLEAIAFNVHQIRSFVSPQTELMAVIKADAYGHGAVQVAQTALEQGVTWLGVATIAEGVELRQAKIQAPILVLGAVCTPQQIQAIAQWQLQPTLCSPRQALLFSQHLQQTLPVHLKIDTGMSRLGTLWSEGAAFVQFVHSLPHLAIASIYSHLATADSLDPTFMRQQQTRFEQVITQVQALDIPIPQLHLANSAATLTSANLHYDLVRIGLALYGLYPGPHLSETLTLKPALAVKARVTQVKMIPAGTGVSYGQTFIAPQPLRLAVVGIGYADGVPRLLSNRMEALIQGQRVPQIGTITMDQLMLDVSTLPDLQEGEIVTLIGKDGDEQITVDTWADTLGTISWEILCGFKPRLPRVIQ